MTDLRQKNKKTLLITLSVVAGMALLAYASVPLYRLICQATGWGGTPQKVIANTNTEVFDRIITVQFNADIARDMPWEFKPEQREVKVRVGQDALVSYTALNKLKKPVTGTAIYNVTPLKAGKYFNKTQCFCFGEQTLNSGEKVHMPVSFYIDPKIMDDRDMNDVHTINLSYTFFHKDSPELEKAMETFYNTEDDSIRDSKNKTKE